MSKVGEKLRAEVKRSQDHVCAMCAIREDGYLVLQVHHILPTSKGGTDDISNLVALCPNCHCRTHSIMNKANAIN